MLRCGQFALPSTKGAVSGKEPAATEAGMVVKVDKLLDCAGAEGKAKASAKSAGSGVVLNMDPPVVGGSPAMGAMGAMGQPVPPA